MLSSFGKSEKKHAFYLETTNCFEYVSYWR